MRVNTEAPEHIDDDSAQLSRRAVLGVTTTAVAGLGVLGIASMSEPANAQLSVSFADTSVTLAPDETVSAVTVSGTVEASYTVDESSADNATLTVGVGDTAGEGVAGGTESYSYDKIDPSAGDITEDVTVSFSVPPEVGDPEPGSAIETEFFVDVYWFVDSADGSLLAEAINSDTAVLRIERSSGDTDSEPPSDTDASMPTRATVGGSFTLDVDIES